MHGITFERLGHLYKARKLIGDIPFEPSVNVWRAFLGACVLHNEVDLEKIAGQRGLNWKNKMT